MTVPPQRGWFGVPGDRMKTAEGNSPSIARAPPVTSGSISSFFAHAKAIKSPNKKSFILPIQITQRKLQN